MTRRVACRPGDVRSDSSMRISVPRSALAAITAIVPPRPSMIFLAIGRPRPVPVRAGREVRVEDLRADPPASIPTPLIADLDRRRAPVAVRVASGVSTPVAALPALRLAASTAWRALVRMLTSASRRRSASVTIGGSAGSRSSVTATPALAAGARRRAASRQSALTSRRELEPDRPREVEHVVDDAVQPRDLLVDVRDRCRALRLPPAPRFERAQRRLDDHQRVADLVRDDGRQPAERRQPLALRRLALEARDRVGQVLNVGPAAARPRPPSVAAAGARSSASGRRWPPSPASSP